MVYLITPINHNEPFKTIQLQKGFVCMQVTGLLMFGGVVAHVKRKVVLSHNTVNYRRTAALPKSCSHPSTKKASRSSLQADFQKEAEKGEKVTVPTLFF